MQRLLSIDVAKGIAIVLVVIGHLVPDNSPQWWLVLNRCIYTFHMPLFLFVSGYIYMATYKPELGYGRFIGKKFSRLLIPYFAASILVISLKLATQGSLYVPNPVTFTTYLEIFYLPAAGKFLWFIWTLFTSFVIIRLCRSRRSRLILLIVATCLGGIQVKWPTIFSIDMTVRMLPYFTLGAVIYDWRKTLKGVYNLRAAWIVWVDFFILFAVHELSTSSILIMLTNAVLPIFGIWGMCRLSQAISRSDGRFTAAILSISACSYTIYLYHTTFEGLGKALFAKFLPDLSRIFTLEMIILTIMGTALPMLLQRYIFNQSALMSKIFLGQRIRPSHN